MDEAIDLLHSLMEPDDIAYILSTPQESSVHMSFGMWLRNHWNLWQETPITKDFKKKFKLFGHADDISGMIMTGLWAKVHGIPVDLQEVAKRYKKHWKKLGVNPEVGEL